MRSSEIHLGSLGVLWEALGVFGGRLVVDLGGPSGSLGGSREVPGGPWGGTRGHRKHRKFLGVSGGREVQMLIFRWFPLGFASDLFSLFFSVLSMQLLFER